MKYILSYTAGFVLVLCIVPTVVLGAPVKQVNPLFPYKTYVSKSVSLAPLSSSTAVYTLTFEVRATGEDVYVPAVATRLLGTSSDEAGAFYEVADGDQMRALGGISGAFLYSTAPRESGYYRIPKHTVAVFTLVVAYRHTDTATDAYHIHMRGFHYTLRSPQNTQIAEREGFVEFRSPEVFLATSAVNSRR
jgi:hypothetical protein